MQKRNQLPTIWPLPLPDHRVSYIYHTGIIKYWCTFYNRGDGAVGYSVCPASGRLGVRIPSATGLSRENRKWQLHCWVSCLTNLSCPIDVIGVLEDVCLETQCSLKWWRVERSADKLWYILNLSINVKQHFLSDIPFRIPFWILGRTMTNSDLI